MRPRVSRGGGHHPEGRTGAFPAKHEAGEREALPAQAGGAGERVGPAREVDGEVVVAPVLRLVEHGAAAGVGAGGADDGAIGHEAIAQPLQAAGRRMQRRLDDDQQTPGGEALPGRREHAVGGGVSRGLVAVARHLDEYLREQHHVAAGGQLTGHVYGHAGEGTEHRLGEAEGGAVAVDEHHVERAHHPVRPKRPNRAEGAGPDAGAEVAEDQRRALGTPFGRGRDVAERAHDLGLVPGQEEVETRGEPGRGPRQAEVAAVVGVGHLRQRWAEHAQLGVADQAPGRGDGVEPLLPVPFEGEGGVRKVPRGAGKGAAQYISRRVGVGAAKRRSARVRLSSGPLAWPRARSAVAPK